MKKFVTILFLIVSFAFSGLAQEPETVSPLFDTEVVRKVVLMDIEGELFDNVVVTMGAYLVNNAYKNLTSVMGTISGINSIESIELSEVEDKKE